MLKGTEGGGEKELYFSIFIRGLAWFYNYLSFTQFFLPILGHSILPRQEVVLYSSEFFILHSGGLQVGVVKACVASNGNICILCLEQFNRRHNKGDLILLIFIFIVLISLFNDTGNMSTGC